MQVWSVEAALEVYDLFGDSKALGNVVFDFLSCSGCQPEDRHDRVALLQDVQVKIILAKILTPVRNAVHFINYKSIYSATLVQFVKCADKSRAFNDFLRG